MKAKNRIKAGIIAAVYLFVTLALLLWGYSVQKPMVDKQEFPFTITYSYQGETKTIDDIYIAEYVRPTKYIGDDSLAWSGYVKDKDRLEPDYYRVAEEGTDVFFVSLNMEPGFLMGDPDYANVEYEPSLSYHGYNGEENFIIEDPAELEEMGFSLVSWEYPEPIENKFSFGGFSLSSEAVIYTSIIAILALISCMLLIKKEPEVTYRGWDKLSIVLNFLVTLIVLPFILLISCFSEIVADASFIQQIIYLSPAITALGVALSVTLRRMGRTSISVWIQFVGPVLFGIPFLIDLL